MTDNQPVTGFKAKIPNILTIGRIILIPVMVWGFWMLSQIVLPGDETSITKPSLAKLLLVLFFILALTDYLDGFLARKWQVTSDFGRMLDPIADKLLVAGCLIGISVAANAYWYILLPSLLIIGRDITVSGLREHAALNSIVMPPTKLAKWKTACEMLAIIVFLIALVLWTQISEDLLNFAYLRFDSVPWPKEFETAGYVSAAGVFLLWVAAILSVYTGALYLRAALKKD